MAGRLGASRSRNIGAGHSPTSDCRLEQVYLPSLAEFPLPGLRGALSRLQTEQVLSTPALGSRQCRQVAKPMLEVKRAGESRDAVVSCDLG